MCFEISPQLPLLHLSVNGFLVSGRPGQPSAWVQDRSGDLAEKGGGAGRAGGEEEKEGEKRRKTTAERRRERELMFPI